MSHDSRLGYEDQMKKTIKVFGVDFTFCWVPPSNGFFDTEYPPVSRLGRNPEYRLWSKVTKGFWLLETPLTKEQYCALSAKCDWVQYDCGDERIGKMRDNQPVSGMTYDQTTEWIDELNKYTNLDARLPTMMEWFWAAKGNEPFIWPGSNNPNLVGYGKEVEGHPDVGLKQPNAYGLKDLASNVSEWVTYPDYEDSDRENVHSSITLIDQEALRHSPADRMTFMGRSYRERSYQGTEAFLVGFFDSAPRNDELRRLRRFSFFGVESLASNLPPVAVFENSLGDELIKVYGQFTNA